MAAHGQRHEHVEGAPVGMGQRQERQRARALIMEPRLYAEHHVAKQIAVCEHHALGKTCRARRVVYHGHVVEVHVGIDNVVAGKAGGIFIVDAAGEPAERRTENALALAVADFVEHHAAVERHSRFHVRQLVEIHMLVDMLAYKEKHGIGVVDNVLGVARIEILKHRHYHGAISDCGHEHGHPVGRILAHKGNFVALFHAAGFIQQMYPCDFFGELAVSQCRVRAVIRYGRQHKVGAERVLVYFCK